MKARDCFILVFLGMSFCFWCVVLTVNGSRFEYFMSNLQLFLHFIIEFMFIELPKAESCFVVVLKHTSQSPNQGIEDKIAFLNLL